MIACAASGRLATTTVL